MFEIFTVGIAIYLIVISFIILVMVLSKRTEAICEAPGLDFIISLLTWIPWVASIWWAGWRGLLGCLLAQFAVLQSFIFIHPILRGHRGSTIQATLNRIAGRFNNRFGVYATLPVLPGFLIIRLTQVCLWPLLVWSLKFPRYRESEWIRVSRHKFSGLVGADLIWCLYCDWMTGVYALGGEMLRNVESFWCPIRFHSDKKCENCKMEFPDIAEWVPPDGTIADVQALLDKKYPRNSSKARSWYGHPDRKA